MKVEKNPMKARRLDPIARAERAALAAERREWAQEDARIARLYEEGSLNRLPQAAPEVTEPARYTVTKLTSAVDTKARGQKAAATRRARAAARKAGLA
jgi:hypothetical protein